MLSFLLSTADLWSQTTWAHIRAPALILHAYLCLTYPICEMGTKTYPTGPLPP